MQPDPRRVQRVLPLFIPSGGNARDGHWSDRNARIRSIRTAVCIVTRTMREPWMLPPAKLHVLMVRQAPRILDTDNLATALKPVRDGIADGLGLPSDRSERVFWQFHQEKNKAGSLLIAISPWVTRCFGCGHIKNDAAQWDIFDSEKQIGLCHDCSVNVLTTY